MSDATSDPDGPADAEGESPDASSTGPSAPADEVADARDGDDAGPDVPDWDDEYVDRVSDRLMYNYDLEKDRTVRGERFTLYGRLDVHSEKHFLHPSLSFGHHDVREHLFVRRTETPSVEAAERLVELGHELADEWIEADEEHYSTDFTFVLVAPTIPDPLRAFVSEFRDRTMIKYGYYGHYEINLVAVAPDEDDIVASSEASVEEAFRLWEPIEKDEPGLLRLIARRFQI
ncbi:hypothetical protein [Halorussus sp. AFM4]|uniref:hypothetical protein n=1 Tax=Halorussus sp. AFM4 TaxID=3421651 RepID=UPI003EB96057